MWKKNKRSYGTQRFIASDSQSHRQDTDIHIDQLADDGLQRETAGQAGPSREDR
ncbi:hypothetical protein DPMN_125303 [Dreissena polymorpha]|uniref:Uncharacterized protein n=1 Tax=Dreissena polymorpha TaxID=45954 RepID=A0A9D4GX91_DREPO|nr:hypothetical protein DPMN_125303 [Dreissena polymorpha]